MAANAVAAVNQKLLSASDRVLLDRYAGTTCGDYCASCGRICSLAASKAVPIHDVMRASCTPVPMRTLTWHKKPSKASPLKQAKCPPELARRTNDEEESNLFA